LDDKKKQIDKFREAARELETDDSEEAFDRVLKRIVKSPTQTESQKKKPKPSQALRDKGTLGD